MMRDSAKIIANVVHAAVDFFAVFGWVGALLIGARWWIG